MVLSAEFSVDGDDSVAAIETTYGSTVDLALVSDTGVNVVAWTIQGTSHESFTAPTITPAGSPSGKTASFAMPADPGGGEGRSVLIKCTVTDPALNQAVAYRVVGVVNDAGVVPIAAGEENHRSATHGWIEPINTALSVTGGGGSLTAPASPADNTKVAFAASGDLDYADNIKVVNSGASLTFGATVAASGDIRGGTSLSIVALSGANDMDLIKASSGTVIVGETTHAASVELQAATSHIFDIAGTDQLTLNATTCTILPALQIGASGGAYATVGHIRVGTLSSDTTVMAWRVAGSDRTILAYTNSGTLVQIGSNSLDTIFRSEARWRGRVSTSTDVIDITSDGSVFRLRAPVVTNGSTGDCSVRATGSNGSNNSGAPLLLEGGRRAGSGTPGSVVLRGNVDDSTFHEGFRVGSSGSAAQITFFGGSLATKQTVTGAKGSNAALGSLLTALAAYGLITDSSSA
jgi:hypothetical protein